MEDFLKLLVDKMTTVQIKGAGFLVTGGLLATDDPNKFLIAQSGGTMQFSIEFTVADVRTLTVAGLRRDKPARTPPTTITLYR